MVDGEALIWPGVKDSRLGEPVIRQLLHSGPSECALLTSAMKDPSPPRYDPVTKGDQRSRICWNCVVHEVAGNDLLQPDPLLWDRLMHSLSQLARNLLKLCPHAVPARATLEEESPSKRLAGNEGEAQKAEGLRFSEPAPLATPASAGVSQ